MIRKLAPAAALLLTVACATSPMTSSSTTSTTSAAPAISQTASTAPDYILLSAPNAAREWNAIDPEYRLHVRGTMTNNGFLPVGGVQGKGKLCADGKDWVSFSDLKVHKASDGGSPTAPYVLGCASNSGFTPASRDLVTQ